MMRRLATFALLMITAAPAAPAEEAPICNLTTWYGSRACTLIDVHTQELCGAAENANSDRLWATCGSPDEHKVEYPEGVRVGQMATALIHSGWTVNPEGAGDHYWHRYRIETMWCCQWVRMGAGGGGVQMHLCDTHMYHGAERIGGFC